MFLENIYNLIIMYVKELTTHFWNLEKIIWTAFLIKIFFTTITFS